MKTGLLSIDAGVHGLGVALFVDRELYDARYLSGVGGAAHPLLEVRAPFWDYYQVAIAAGLGGVVIEKPKVYDTAHQKGGLKGQADLINLAIVIGTLTVGITVPILLVEPSEWKGQTPKNISNARTLERLTTAEKTRIDCKANSVLHNVLDGIGIGLHRLGRDRKG